MPAIQQTDIQLTWNSIDKTIFQESLCHPMDELYILRPAVLFLHVQPQISNIPAKKDQKEMAIV